MPSQIALLLCFAFVLFLLRIERKEAPTVSPAAWIPTFWMLYCASKPFATWFGSGGGGDIEAGSPLDRNFLSLLMALGLLVIAARRRDWAAVKRDNTWLWLICLYALFSIAWSEFPLVSIKRYIRFLGSIVMAFVLLTEPAPKLALESVLRRTVYVLIPFSLLLIKYFPAFGVIYTIYSGEILWVGTATQKNSLGVLCLVAIFILFWRQLRAWQRGCLLASWRSNCFDALMLLMSVYLLRGPSNMAASKSAFVVMSFGTCCLVALLWMKKRGRYMARNSFLAVVVLVYIYGFGVPFGLTSLFSGVLQAMGRDTTFTGRTEIWAELIPVVSNNPVLGVGYGGFWVHAIESQVNEAHNGYLDVMIELGLVGILLLFGFVVAMCHAAYAKLPRDFWWSSFSLCFLLMVLLHNTSESTFLKTSDFQWTLIVFLQMLLPTAAPQQTEELDAREAVHTSAGGTDSGTGTSVEDASATVQFQVPA